MDENLSAILRIVALKLFSIFSYQLIDVISNLASYGATTTS
jgi:hypothetical protein